MAYLKNSRVQHFLKTVRSQCKKCNVRFTLSSGYEVNAGGERCQGYFTEPWHTQGHRGELRVAVGGRKASDWLYPSRTNTPISYSGCGTTPSGRKKTM